ncbi:uroporphyrinogen-III C-methyltransferase [Echinicola jeungdonensis]|uniref:uroporphyrinogen-III C-methyltransferase n=1 Tax=Echinicola jeungdonensis TaxID=709343 RepID=A0ABV5J5S6_9BACT|nr:uroporphyrinogen-III C-methyltransferase [Echinicola jeungdonensis]MDN3668892.1 uroporphyrinogen-III C-methyltransferase [Echinicola jeungdonensis]
MTTSITPKLTLVGAGPGDPELITLKGILALGKADVILYDALVDKSLLKHATKNALKVFVGKRHGSKNNPQEDTNSLIVHYALKYGHVVRLKGGDPFVFGRGAEEIDHVKQYGIETEVIPGITSSVAVPASQGIPVTKRGISESFWVITGTTSSGQLSRDIQIASQSTATVVILMGTRKLSEIVQAYSNAGKKECPIALIQNGTTPQEKVVAGTIHDIEQKVKETGIGAPAVIIVGEVVRESLKMAALYQEVINSL